MAKRIVARLGNVLLDFNGEDKKYNVESLVVYGPTAAMALGVEGVAPEHLVALAEVCLSLAERSFRESGREPEGKALAHVLYAMTARLEPVKYKQHYKDTDASLEDLAEKLEDELDGKTPDAGEGPAGEG